ncbi:MAG TPA: IPT/TIG domain-containing protein [Bryobacteraceae bacterium]|jgi:nitrogen fixation protein FixH
MEYDFHSSGLRSRWARFFVLLGVCICSNDLSAATISYVQSNYATPQSAQTTVSVTFTKAQKAGDLNVVVVGWNDSTATVTGVTDKSGNRYTLAVGPTVQGPVASQSIYYANNVAAAGANANAVKVTFSSGATSPDIRILEYSGADPNNPVDVAMANTGSSATSSSGAATTTNATDLIFGANLVQTVTSGPGSGFTRRLLTSPDGDIAEDRMVTSVGSYSATAPLNSGQWIMQMVAFRAAAGTAPTVSSVSPNSGPTAGGTAVTITGTNFAAGASVTIGGTAATNVTVVNATTITATTPAGSAGAATVTVTVSGQSGSLANGFTYSAATIIGFVQGNYATPQSAQISVSVPYTAAQKAGDLNVVVVGWNDSAATVTGVKDADGNQYVRAVGPTVLAPMASQSIYYAKNIAAAAAGANSVTVTFSTGAAYPDIRVLEYSGADLNNPVDVTAAASGNSATSSSGPATTTNPTDLIFGANLVLTTTGGPGSGFTTRLLTSPDGDIAEDQMVAGVGSYSATAPLGSGQWIMQMVAFRTPSGPLPTVSGVSPNSGPATGGTNVTITGGNFAAGAAVTFGGGAASNVVVVNATTITATTPAGAGVVTVTVANPGGLSGSLAGGFTYISPPTVSGVAPNGGPVAGGTAVTITGGNFAAGAAVKFGASAATNVTVVNAATITATTPAGSAGAVTVSVTNTNGLSGTLVGGYTYLAPPTVSSVAPNSGTTTGGTAVTITGMNFASGASVTFGGAAAANVTVVNATTITATTPAGSAGAVTVSVTVSGQSGNLANGFTYVVAPTVTSVSPSSGPTAGGTAVTITGTNFATGATVAFGATAATNVTVVNATTITATTPAGSAGAATVTVTVSGKTGSLTNGFTYVGAATISFVQSNYATPQSPQSSVSVAYTAAQKAGDLNVVVVGWNDSTAAVTGIKDSEGNQYALAVGPTILAPVASQSIYYAKNIASAAAGANNVTVTFSPAAVSPDIRVLEYSGVDSNNPLDVKAASSGTSATSSSGSAATTNPTDLIFGANLVQNLTTGPGGGFTSRLLTSPDGDIAEDLMATATGSYSATAPLNSVGQWIMQMVAFRSTPPGNTPVVNLSATSINFGNQATGVAGSPQPVTLKNIGTAPLTISSIAVSGGNAGDFTQSNNCGSTLAPNSPCTINATFTPKNTGARSSTIVINDNAPGSPQSIALSGTGTGFSVAPAVSVLTFNQTQQFTAAGSPAWSVDGVAGGSAAVGTITSTGLYTPPNSIGVHTVTATASSQSASATVYVTNYPGTFTYHNDNLRTGQNTTETVLTTSNVNQSQFGKLFSYPLDGIAFASPLYVAHVNIPGQGFHNAVYVATENDSVYAFDADGLTASPLWRVNFLKSGVTTVPCGDTGECGDIPNQIGITSTPVIDSAGGTLYVVAATKEGSSTWVQRLHALDITTGAEKFGGPVVLQGSVPGTGSGASGGRVAFDPLRENQRPALLLSNGVVYLAFGSHGDQSPWHGWVFGYNATTLQQTTIYNVTPNGEGGGIWHSGGGLATDTTGTIYFVTGNGDFDANTGGKDYGDSVEKLNPSGTVVDYFTPHDQQNMNLNDFDLGAAGPVMLVDQTSGPYPHLLIMAGKTGSIYVINRDNMGHFNAAGDTQIVQSLPGALPYNFSTPVYFNGYVYFGGVNDSIKAFQLTNGQLSTVPASQTAAAFGVRGASFAISANGTNNGILWAIQNNGATADNDVGSPGVLFAYTANNLSSELYDSSQAGSRDTLDNAAKFSVPLVANGKVFVAGQSQLTAFGLLP